MMRRMKRLRQSWHRRRFRNPYPWRNDTPGAHSLYRFRRHVAGKPVLFAAASQSQEEVSAWPLTQTPPG